MPAKADRKQIPGRFQPGVSGNPHGRPVGSKHKATLAAQALLDGEAEGLTRKCVEMALAGDMGALRLCLDRIIPARRGRPVLFDLPPMRTVKDALKAAGVLVELVSKGDLTPAEGASVAALIEQYRKTFETIEIEARLRELEGDDDSR